MSKLTVNREHQLGLDGVQRLMDEWVEDGRTRLGLHCEVVRTDAGVVVTFQRPGISGTIQASSRHLALDAKLGFLLSPYAGRITDEIHRQLDVRLGPTAG